MHDFFRRRPLIVAGVLALLLLPVLGGCAKKTTTGYPAVSTEPTISKPSAPIVWPYTGLKAPSAQAIKKRPISVKIENSNPARPQKGLNSADIVYETMVEGGITRFNCIFQSKLPKELGPVRSARLSDIWIVPQYGAMFYFSGANSQVAARVKNRGINDMSQSKAPSLYHRISFKSAPHNLYMSTKSAYKLAEAKGFSTTFDKKGLDFGTPSTEATKTATTITIPFSYYAKITWKYDTSTNTYLRFNSGAAHKDGATGEQVNATNVVVLWAKYTTQTKLDHAGSVTYDTALGGSGKAAVFKDGTRTDVTWEADKNTPPHFTDKDGNTVKLNPGKTWFEVPNTGIKINASGK
ncbi:MAG: DUF3048 domain-containing protein [Coriobacteriia bacterium]|nr:DUF3048 domain-containing protein [Coriobacteriia bacterium]